MRNFRLRLCLLILRLAIDVAPKGGPAFRLAKTLAAWCRNERKVMAAARKEEV